MATNAKESCRGDNSQTSAIDPVCKMSVYPAKARSTFVWKDQTYYFCCTSCQQQFSASPESFLMPAADPVGDTNRGSCCHPRPLPVPTSAVDPVCGMNVKVADSPHQLKLENTAYYFCCAGCRHKFNMSPSYFLGESKRPARKSAVKTLFVCPMHPQVKSDAAGDCPDCGMPLEAAFTTANDTQSEPDETSLRLRVSTLFTVPLVLLGMTQMLFMSGMQMGSGQAVSCWLQLLLATPVVGWAARPFFERGWRSIVTAKLNMFTLLSLGIAIPYVYSLLSLIADAARGTLGAHMLYFESAAVITTLAWLGQLLESRARTQSTSAVRDLLGLLPEEATVLFADGSEEQVPATKLIEGARVRIRPGDRIPADGQVLSGESTIDESMLSGEALPVYKGKSSWISAGTLNQDGALIMSVSRCNDDTTVAQIAAVVSEAQRSRVPVQQLADHVAAIFVPAVALIGVATFAGWLWLGAGVVSALTFATAVFVIACPCALGLATPISIVVATGRAARAGVLFKQAHSLQQLAKIDTVVLDKTGTLTEGSLSVADIVTADGTSEDELLALAHSLAFQSKHPLSRAIVKAATATGLPSLGSNDWQSQPGGLQATINGTRRVAMGSAKFLAKLGVDPHTLSSSSTCCHIAEGDRWLGTIFFADTLKPGAAEAVRWLQANGVQVVLASGDVEPAVNSIATALGITSVHAQVTPADKAALLNSLKAAGHRVAMVGDGINDAPALATADVGIAMSNGSDIAINTADIVLLNGDLSGLIRGRKIAGAMLSNIHQNLFLAFGYNLVSVPLAAGLLLPIAGLVLNPMVAALAMAMSSVCVILNALRLRNIAV